MCENFKYENYYILISITFVVLLIFFYKIFKDSMYITVKVCKNGEDTIIQNVFTKQYYKSYNDHYGMIRKEKINYKIK